MKTIQINYLGFDAEVEYTYYEGEPEVHTLPNGDPGTPGSPPSVEVARIWVELESDEGRTVTVDIMSVMYMTNLEDEILELYH